MSLQHLTVSSSSEDPVAQELHQTSRNFFFRPGIHFLPTSPVRLSAYLPVDEQVPEFEYPATLELRDDSAEDDLIDLHPSPNDVLPELELNARIEEDPTAEPVNAEFNL